MESLLEAESRCYDSAARDFGLVDAMLGGSMFVLVEGQRLSRADEPSERTKELDRGSTLEASLLAPCSLLIPRLIAASTHNPGFSHVTPLFQGTRNPLNSENPRSSKTGLGLDRIPSIIPPQTVKVSKHRIV